MIFYGAILSFAQTDIKRLVAYSSVSHMGFVLIGIYSGSPQALQGVVVQMIAHGLSAAGLFILCGQLYERMHTRDMRQMGGLWAQVPYLPALSLFFASASLGLPGTGNFVGEFLILLGALLIDHLLPHRETRARRWARRIALVVMGSLAGIAGRLLVGWP